MSAAQDIAELMAAWNTVIAAAREQFPHATEERLYQIAKSVMTRQLGESLGAVVVVDAE